MMYRLFHTLLCAWCTFTAHHTWLKMMTKLLPIASQNMHWSSHLHEHCTWCTGRVIHPIRASACWHPSLYFFAWARYTVLKCRDTDAHICMSMMWSLGSLHRTPNAWCSHLTRSKCKYPIPLAIPTVLSTDNIFLLIATVHDKQSLPPYLNVCAIPASVVKAVASKI